MAFPVSAGLLDACVLAVLNRGDTYGYVLTQQIRSVVDVSESTLYPVLRRLQRDGLLAAYDSPYQGRNRRYYAITPYGRTQYGQYLGDWDLFKANVEQLLFGGKEEDD